MIDLTDPFKEALSRKGSWRYQQAKDMAIALRDAVPGAKVVGTSSENWLWVRNDHGVQALVYLVAPLVIVSDELAEATKSELQSVVVVNGLLGYNDDLFSMNPKAANELLPYPLSHDVWDWDGFAASDLVAETF